MSILLCPRNISSYVLGLPTYTRFLVFFMVKGSQICLWMILWTWILVKYCWVFFHHTLMCYCYWLKRKLFALDGQKKIHLQFLFGENSCILLKLNICFAKISVSIWNFQNVGSLFFICFELKKETTLVDLHCIWYWENKFLMLVWAWPVWEYISIKSFSCTLPVFFLPNFFFHQQGAGALVVRCWNRISHVEFHTQNNCSNLDGRGGDQSAAGDAQNVIAFGVSRSQEYNFIRGSQISRPWGEKKDPWGIRLPNWLSGRLSVTATRSQQNTWTRKRKTIVSSVQVNEMSQCTMCEGKEMFSKETKGKE